MNACEGDFSPNATASHAHYNVTHCSKLMKTAVGEEGDATGIIADTTGGWVISAQYNVSAQLDHELRVGPLHLDLADLGFTDDIQKQLNKIPKLLRAFAVLYLLATALTGISMLTSAAALMTVPQQPRRRSGYRQRRQPGLSARAVTIANLVVACLAATVLLIADATATAAGHEAAKEVNKHGTRVGLRAHVGKQFLIMVWVAFGTAVVTVGYWSWAVWKGKRSGWDGAGSGGGLKKSVSRRSDDSFAPPPPMRSV
ncbi:hypothetical protein VTK73DRAFT_2268 [Phialemonium thermophilum]|uniref:Uncharacterized protein n=1 Tax=Phialemonium thermophilum TaxID=223376 RepID=A0ABR3VSE3_9PEZI